MKTRTFTPLHTLWLLIACVPPLLSQEARMTISRDLELVPLNDHTFIHVSYFDLQNAQHYPANGLVFVDHGEALLIDTPWTVPETSTLIDWLADSLSVRVSAAVFCHWHKDCMGGIDVVKVRGIANYAHELTGRFAKERKLTAPDSVFSGSLELSVGTKRVVCEYLGGGHTRDNIVVWIPEEKILFGGCLLKALSWTGLGYLGDADVEAWPSTLKRLLEKHPDARVVIPGHGERGDLSIVRHTLDLLEKRAR